MIIKSKNDVKRANNTGLLVITDDHDNYSASSSASIDR